MLSRAHHADNLDVLSRLERLTRAYLRFMGGRFCVLTVVLLSLGWVVQAPPTVRDHAAARRFGSDYAAFDAAAALVRHGDASSLYDTGAQKAAQRERAPDGRIDSYLAFLYPPVVAVLLVPLTYLSLSGGFVAFAALLAAACAAIGWLLWRETSDLPRYARIAIVACSLGSTATVTSILVGQLTPMLLLDALVGMALLRRDRPIGGGLVLGLLFLKPQVGVAALFVALVSRQRALAAAMLGCGVVLAAASVAIVGIDGAREYVALMRIANDNPGSIGVAVRAEQNIRGLVATIFGVDGGPGIAGAQLAVLLASAVAAIFALIRAPYTGVERVSYAAAIAAMLMVAGSPHVQYYDLGLLVLPALFIARRGEQLAATGARRRVRGVLVTLIIGVEVAGLLASGKLSVTAPAALAMFVAVCAWPRLEAAISTEGTEATDRVQPLTKAA